MLKLCKITARLPRGKIAVERGLDMKKWITVLVLVLLAVSLVACGTDNAADVAEGDWEPTKDITMIVAFKAGSGTDTGARILASVAEKYLDQNLVIVNKEGADGKIGYTDLVNAAPDGHTIGFINLPTFNSLALEADSVFSSETITPIANHVSEPALVVVRKDAPYDTIEEFIEYAKANPGAIKVSTNGVKASNHIAIQLLAKEADFEISAIPYGGTADQLLALRQGEVDASVPKVADVINLLGENGELKALATYTEERVEDLDDVPTLTEKGYPLIFGSYRCIVAPKDTPQNVIDYYADVFKKTMEDEENIEKSDNAGLSVQYMDPQELADFIATQDKFAQESLPSLFED